MEEIIIRGAVPGDAPRLLEIYSPYVTETAVSFELCPPTADDFERRISLTLEKYPYLVAVKGGTVVGYAYAGELKKREAYSHSAELSVYIDRTVRRSGIGRLLYSELEKVLRRQNVRVLYACIAVCDAPDMYLTPDSVCFHSALGFRYIGTFTGCGYKFGRWYNMAWMEKHIICGENIGEFIPFSALPGR